MKLRNSISLLSLLLLLVQLLINYKGLKEPLILFQTRGIRFFMDKSLLRFSHTKNYYELEYQCNMVLASTHSYLSYFYSSVLTEM